MALDITVPQAYATTCTALVNASSTAAKILVDCPIAGGNGANGALTNANLLGGGRIVGIDAYSTDTSVRYIQPWIGHVITTIGAATGTTTVATTTTIVRTSGSWITDGWQVGDIIMVFSPIWTNGTQNAEAPQTNNGVLSVVSIVTALTLTVSIALTTETLNTGCRVCRMSAKFIVATTAYTSATTATVNTSLLNNIEDTNVDRSGIYLAQNALYAVSVGAAVTNTAGDYISFEARTALF